MCPLCADKGLFRIGYHEPPNAQGDLAICLCRPGRNFRAQIERGVLPLLAHRYAVPVDNVGLAEEFLDVEDIPASMRMRPVPSLDIAEAGVRVGKAKL